MATVTIDGAAKLIALDSVGAYDAADIYAAWKEWAIAGGLRYAPAFDTTGGDGIGGGERIAPYYFLRNDLGWRIVPPGQSGEVVVNGNLFPRDASAPVYNPAPGGVSVLIRQQVSSRATVLEVGGSGLTPAEAEKIEAVWRRQGLDPAAPLRVTDGAIEAGDIVQSVTDDGTETKVERQ